MAEEKMKPILGKVVIAGKMKCVTGLHVGAVRESLEIGGVTSVIRDPLSREPYVPGSSLKGKLRSLLERSKNLEFNRHGGGGIYRHECASESQAKDCPVCRVFGSTGQDGGANFPARLKVRDCRLTNDSKNELLEIDTDLLYAEWKSENTLDRITAAAMPRDLERIPAGAEFKFEFIYDIEKSEDTDTDLINIFETLGLLQDDALGGHGSRGYGKVEFKIDTLTGKKIEAYAGKPEATKELKDLAIESCAEKVKEITEFYSS